jgi:hypothetical protein
MKTKLYAALVAGMALAGLFVANPHAVVAEPACVSVGQTCSVGSDGTIYPKGNEAVTF